MDEVGRDRDNEYEVAYTWVGDAEVVPARVQTLAFTADGEMLLVGGTPGATEFWLPGGGIEVGESPEQALARELLEEAAATIHEMRPIGSQRVDYPETGSEFHSFYWSRVTLADDFVPEHEVTERRLVGPDEFLDALCWGRSDPTAALLLERALAVERERQGRATSP